jgi:hypothetical protein
MDANSVSLTLPPVDALPVAAPSAVTTSQNLPQTFLAIDFAYTDLENEALVSVTVTSLPAKGELKYNGTTLLLADLPKEILLADIANLSYLPALNESGLNYTSFSFTVRDTTAQGIVAAPLTINVTAVDALPVAAPSTATTTQNTTYTFQAANFAFTDLENEALVSVKIASLPAVGVLQYNGSPALVGQVVTLADFAASKLQFVPVTNANGSPYTSFSFSVADTTAAGTATAPMTVNVTAVNTALTDLALAPATTPETSPLGTEIGTLTTVDADGVAPYVYTLVTGAGNTDNALVTIVGDKARVNGALSFETNPTLEIRVRTTDAGGLWFEKPLVIAVTNVNTAPVARDDWATTPEETPVTITVLTNDTDADGGTLTIIGISVPANGTAAVNPDGTVLYTPEPGFIGLDTFTYTITDGQGGTSARSMRSTDTISDGQRGAKGVRVKYTVASSQRALDRALGLGGKLTLKAAQAGTDSATVTVEVTPADTGLWWYPYIPWDAVPKFGGGNYEWYNIEIWDVFPGTAGKSPVLNTNVKGTAMAPAEEYLLAGSDGLLPVTHYWRYRTWAPETDTYGATWLPATSGASGQALPVDYDTPPAPVGLTCTADPDPTHLGSFILTFTANNAQGYELQIFGNSPQNTQLLPRAYFMPGADYVVPFNQVTTRTVTLAGSDSYHWQVRGFNPSGESPWSTSRGAELADIAVGTSFCPIPAAVDYRHMRPADTLAGTVIAAEPGGVASFAFQWDPVPGAAGYVLYVASNIGQPILNYVDVENVTRYDNPNGMPPGSYLWCLIAYSCAEPRVYGEWNHSMRSPGRESPVFFEVIADDIAPTITAAVIGVGDTVNITWAGPALASVDVLLFNSASPGWQEALDQPVSALPGARTGSVPLGGLTWQPGANYLLLTATTAGTTTAAPKTGPRSRLFVIRVLPVTR